MREELKDEYEFLTGSDCEVILALYRKYGVEEMFKHINGMFAFALYDIEKDLCIVARDHIGIIPLYIGWDRNMQFYAASELKALEGTCTTIRPFEPGHYYTNKDHKMIKWYNCDWRDYNNVKDNDASVEELRKALKASVKRQLMSDVPYGVLLSGGLDSSIISAVAKEYASRRIESDGSSEAWYPQLHSFAVGLKGAPDLIAAQKVADHIGTIHHEVNYTIKEGIDASLDGIYYIET